MTGERSRRLFSKAAKELPAYRSFLKAKGFNSTSVADSNGFKRIPPTSKKQYLQAYPLEELVWKDDLAGPLLFCSTSGSTGEPYYFPRKDELSVQYSHMLESFLTYSSYGPGRTLVLVGFGMGVWIGGIITLRALELASASLGSPISILPTGYNKNEIFKALRKLSPNFSQTIIVGYPPFIKELVDEAPLEGVDLKSLNIRFLFAAESFSETFRNYVCSQAGITNPLLDTVNIYGTADIGAMAYETPLSILIRRLVIEDPLLNRDVFNQIEKTPTLAQYNPDFIEFEAIGSEIFLTADGALPLIRYAIGDNGGVFDYEQIKANLHRYNVNLDSEIQKAGILKTVNKQHPFVFVYERKDLSASLHGINIYPEFIKEGLLTKASTPFFTERFTMSTKNDIHHNQFLQINLELKKNIEPSKELKAMVAKVICSTLIHKSSEFAEISKSQLASKLIQVELWPNGHKRYFAPGTKQKWVEKT